MIVGDQRPQGCLSSLVVVPDRGGEGEDALQDPDRDPHPGAAAMAFQVQLSLEGLVNPLDQLPQRPEQVRPGRSGSPLRAGRNNRRPNPASTR